MPCKAPLGTVSERGVERLQLDQTDPADVRISAFDFSSLLPKTANDPDATVPRRGGSPQTSQLPPRRLPGNAGYRGGQFWTPITPKPVNIPLLR